MAQLPEELLEAIFANLKPRLLGQYFSNSDENRVLCNALAAVCRVSRACSRIATPMLYPNVELYNRTDTKQICHAQTSACHSNFLPLLRTCLSRQDLTLQIRGLKVPLPSQASRNALTGIQHPRQSPVPPLGLYGPVLDALPLSPELRSSLLDGFKRGSEDAALALLLLRARNLEHLEYAIGFPLTKRSIIELGGPAIERPLPKLRALTVRGRSAPLRLSNIEPFFCCPQLTTVRAFNFHAALSWNPTYPCCSSVQRLELHQGGFTYQGLEQLFRCFPGLLELSISMIGTTLRAVHGHAACPSPGVVGDALRVYGGRLEKLHLVIEMTKEDMEPGCGAAGRAGPLGDLRSLESLWELTTTGAALLGYKPVPYMEENWPQMQIIEIPINIDANASLVETLPLGLETLRIVEHARLPGSASLEYDDARLGHYGELLREQTQRLCGDARFEKLRRVELEWSAASAMEEAWIVLGWRTEYKADRVVLTRD